MVLFQVDLAKPPPSDFRTAREFTRFTANACCSYLAPPASCRAQCSFGCFWTMGMDHHNRQCGAADHGGTPFDEELWSLKVVLAKTGLSRSTLYTYIAAGTFPTRRRLGKRRVAWFASEVKAGLPVGRRSGWHFDVTAPIEPTSYLARIAGVPSTSPFGGDLMPPVMQPPASTMHTVSPRSRMASTSRTP
jgi:prophage regulatory protein